ncbi:MAG: glycosyltransferase family 4 protein [Candidatus Latescibacteria bacterium]|nr:glycosyltransferase family 4 protein [Candidatus Latescibacterota bacterium]
MSRKIIQILHHSPSWTSQNLEEDIYNGWHIQTAKAIQKLGIKNCRIECWLPEKTCHKQYLETKDDITYRVFPSRVLTYGREFSPCLINALKQEVQNQIIIHLHGIFNYLTYAIANNCKSIPIIAQHHGDCPPLSLLSRRKLLYSILPLLILENFACRKHLSNIDHFLCLTHACQQSISRFGIDGKTNIQTMGIDFNQFVPADKIQVRKKIGLSLDKKIILYIGRLDQYKASAEVIYAFNKLKDKMPVESIIVGAQVSDPYYNLALKSGCTIIPRQRHDRLKQYYQTADLLVLPGSDQYNKWGGIGVNVIESLACNTPVVSGTLCHFPEDCSQIGILASKTEKIADGVMHILNNPAQYSRCRELAQKYYDWKIIAQNTFTIYERLFLEYYNQNLELSHG